MDVELRVQLWFPIYPSSDAASGFMRCGDSGSEWGHADSICVYVRSGRRMFTSISVILPLKRNSTVAARAAVDAVLRKLVFSPHCVWAAGCDISELGPFGIIRLRQTSRAEDNVESTYCTVPVVPSPWAADRHRLNAVFCRKAASNGAMKPSKLLRQLETKRSALKDKRDATRTLLIIVA